jgi:N-acetylmuramoyl-L-alanine amidase
MATIKNHRLTSATYIASPNKGGAIEPIFIVQHYTAGYTAQSAINTLVRKGSGVSAHVVVDLDGTITQLVPFNVRAWHAGPSSHMGYNGLNNYSIGIEIVNIGWMRQTSNGQYQDSYGNIRSDSDFPNGVIFAANSRVGGGVFAWPNYTPEQIEAVRGLTQALCEKYKIKDIVSHEEIDSRGWKTDPGPAFPMKLMKQYLASDRGHDSDKWNVTATSLRVRSGPGTNFDTLGSLDFGDEVNVLARNGDWVKIDQNGWVHGGFLQKA